MNDRNPTNNGIHGSVPWPVSRIDPKTGFECVASTRINHQPATRPYSTVLQIIEHDDNGYPIKWVVRDAHWRYDPEERVMVPDSYGNGDYYWHGRPFPTNRDGDPIQPYLDAWQRAIEAFCEKAASTLTYDINMMTFGRTHPVTGQRLES